MNNLTQYQINLIDEIKHDLLMDYPSAKQRLIRSIPQFPKLYKYVFNFSDQISQIKELKNLLGDQNSIENTISNMTDEQCVNVISLINETIFELRLLNAS